MLATALLLLAAGACAVVAACAWRDRAAPGAPGLVVLLAAIVVWDAGYAVEIAAADASLKLLAVRVQYVGIVVVPAATLAFALGHAGLTGTLTRGRLALLALVPVVVLALAASGQTDQLVFSVDGPVAAWQPLPLAHGVAFAVLSAWSYALLLGATSLLARSRLALARHATRRRAVALWTAILAPWAGNALYLVGTAPSGFDPTTLGFAVSAVALAVAVGRWDVLGLVPVARDALVEHLRDGVVVLDRDGRVVDANPAAAPLLSCPVADVVGRRAADVLPAGVLDAAGPLVVRIDDRRGGVRPYDVEDVPLPAGASHGGRVLLFRDARIREQLHAELRSAALTDELTGLPNRRAFVGRLRAELEDRPAADRHLGVLVLDLDGFKAINDELGHLAGDAVLAVCARRLQAHVRPEDVVARFGGDEFTVLLPDLRTEAVALAVADRIATALTEPISLDGRLLRVGVSVGLHVVAGGEVSAEAVLASADARMYAEKARGR